MKIAFSPPRLRII